MNKQISAILAAAFVATTSTLLADSAPEASAQDTKKMVQNNFVETAQKGIKLSGYVDAGYSYNFNGQPQQVVAGREGVDTAYKGDFNLYAVKIALEKALTSENKAQAGFRTDVMIGEDANYLINRETTVSRSDNSANNNSNALFLEQAYVAIRAPVGNGWDFKVGKFVSILGYEVIERPANMNVTYGLLWQQFPLYYTGVLSSYRFDDYVDAKIGVVNGSNSDNNTTTGLGGDGCAVLAALNVTAPGGNANWSNNFQYSSNAENNSADAEIGSSSTSVGKLNESSGTGYTFIYNSWGNWAPKFADDKLLLAFNSVLGTANSNNSTNSASVGNSGGSTWYGAGAYAKYQFNDWFSLCSRGEYLGGNNLGLVSSYPPYSEAGFSWWEYTLTAGFNVIDNLLIRAEYRMDWGTNSTQGNLNNIQGSGFGSGPSYYAGAEIVYSF